MLNGIQYAQHPDTVDRSFQICSWPARHVTALLKSQSRDGDNGPTDLIGIKAVTIAELSAHLRADYQLCDPQGLRHRKTLGALVRCLALKADMTFAQIIQRQR